MIAALTAAWSWFKGASLFWKLAPAIALAAVVIGGVYLWQRLTIAELRADLVASQRDAAIYEETGRRTAESFERYIAQTERDRAAVAEQSARARERAVALDRLEREITDAEGGDAPAGALADSVLDRLRELSAAGD